MATRMKSITKFNENTGSGYPESKPEKVKVHADMSEVRHSGIKSGLESALAHRGMPILPSDHHIWTHTTRVEPAGAHYSPMGEFGKREEIGKGRGVYSYGGAPNKQGENPLGHNLNREGENPLGHALNKVGSNVLGKPSKRPGQNPLGHPDNRAGEKSGYPKFTPHGGGKHP